MISAMNTLAPFLVGIVVPDPNNRGDKGHSGGAKVLLPALHDPNNFTYENLPWARYTGDGSQGSVQTLGGGLDPGTLVLVSKLGPGQHDNADVTILGVLPNTIMKSGGMPGATSMMGPLQYIFNHKTDKKAPPKKLKTTTRDGAEVREVEDNDMWYTNMVRGIPASATLWPMSGIFLPQVSSVATAIQHSTNILDSSLLSALPGVSMTLGGLLNTLNSSGLFSAITQNMQPDIADAFYSMSNLITQVEATSSFGFAVGGRVHEETYMNNAVGILSVCSSIAELCEGMNRLTYDDSLFGTENLEPVTVKRETPYGNCTVQVSHNGTVNSTINIASILSTNTNTANIIANTAASLGGSKEEQDENINYMSSIAGFVNMLSSPSQAFAASGENMFGNSAPRMFDMFNRMNSGATSHMKNLVETVNIGEKEQKKLKPKADIAFNGGNPLDSTGFA